MDYRSKSSSALGLPETLSNLKKSNEELRSRILELEASRVRESIGSISSESSTLVIQKLCERESQELRSTVAKLEKLLDLERQEKASNDEKALELLVSVRRQWQEREENITAKLRNEVEAANVAQHQLTRQNVKITAELEKTLNELESVLEVKNGLKAKCIQLKKKLDSLAESYKSKTLKIQELEAEKFQVSSYKTEYEIREKEVREELNQKVKRLESEKAVLLCEISNLQDQIPPLHAKIYASESSLRKLKEKEESLIKNLNDSIKENDSLKQKLAEAEWEILTKEARLSSLEELVPSLETKLELKSESNRTLSGEISALKSKLSNTKDEVKKLKDNNENLREKLRDLENVLDETTVKNDSFVSKLSGQDNEIDRLEKTNKELKVQIGELKKALRSSKEDKETAFRKAERDLEQASDDLMQSEDRVKDLENLLSSKEKALYNADCQKVQSAEELTKKQKELDGCNKELISLREALSKFKSQETEALETEKKRLLAEKKDLEEENQRLWDSKKSLEVKEADLKELERNLNTKMKDIKEKEDVLINKENSFLETIASKEKMLESDRLRLDQERLHLTSDKELFENQNKTSSIEIASKLDKINKEKEALIEERSNLKAEKLKLSDSKADLESLKEQLKIEQEKISEESFDNLQKEKLELEKELSLNKVSLRLAERNAKKHEENVTYLRSMYRDERSSIRDVQSANEDLKSKLESAENNIKSLGLDIETKDKVLEKLRLEKQELSTQVCDLRDTKAQLVIAKSDLERVTENLNNTKKEILKCREAQTQLNSYKAACLELEDQVKDYECLVTKLEEAKNKFQSDHEESKNKTDSMKAENTDLKITINELKSKEAFALSQLKEAKSKTSELETIYGEEETRYRDRLIELNSAKEEQTATICDLKTQIESMMSQVTSLSEVEKKLRSSLSEVKTDYTQLLTEFRDIKTETVNQTNENEDLRIRLVLLHDELQKEKEEASRLEARNNKKEHGFNIKINQLEKLVDYLQSKLNKQRTKSKSLFSRIESGTPESGGYDALKVKLKDEENKNKQLLKDLNNIKGEIRMKDPILLPTPNNDQVAKHSIPHRWSSGTNMKVTKCSTCYGTIHFCHQASVCQFCDLSVHPDCQENSPDDCGLPKTLKPVLKSSLKTNKKYLFEGTLKVPEQGGRYWKPVTVQIKDLALLIKEEGAEMITIDLAPPSGFVFIQSSVMYTELLHTTAYDQPHIFKIGYSLSKETHYFMAKSFRDKATWIKEIENATQKGKESPGTQNKQAHDIIRGRIATLSLACNVYCVVPMGSGPKLLLGTSEGFLYVNDGSAVNVQGTSVPVFQMEVVLSIEKILLIFGVDRKLSMLSTQDLKRIPDEELVPIPVDHVKSCHLFGTGIVNDDVYLCAADDAQVGLFCYDPQNFRFRMVHKFVTDKPTSCIRFTDFSVLVITDKIYEIDLEDFAVDEFLDLEESPATLSNNYPIAMFQLNDNEFLLCFQDQGIFVDSAGTESKRKTLKWNSISGQFALVKGKLYVSYYNSVEIISLEDPSKKSKMKQCKNPQILTCQDYVYLLQEDPEGLALLELD